MTNLPHVHNALSYTIFLNCFFHGQNAAPSQVLLLEIQCQVGGVQATESGAKQCSSRFQGLV